MKFLEHRIGDPRILRLIRKWLSIVREISVSFSERRTTVKDRLPLSKEWGCQRILRMGRIKEERREVRGRRRAACDESETEKKIHRTFLSTLNTQHSTLRQEEPRMNANGR